MDHSTFLSLKQDWEQGRLDAARSQAWQAHLQGCPACRVVLARWDESLSVPDLAPAVLARLEGPRWAWIPLGLAAALLLATAFWVPERGWLAKDPGDAAWEQGGWR